jgi:hypothetical protein
MLNYFLFARNDWYEEMGVIFTTRMDNMLPPVYSRVMCVSGMLARVHTDITAYNYGAQFLATLEHGA